MKNETYLHISNLVILYNQKYEAALTYAKLADIVEFPTKENNNILDKLVILIKENFEYPVRVV